MVSLTAFYWLFTFFPPSKPCCVYRVESNETNDLGQYCTKNTVVLNSLYVPGSTAKVVYFVYSSRYINGLIATEYTDQDTIILGAFLDYENKDGEAISG